MLCKRANKSKEYYQPKILKAIVNIEYNLASVQYTSCYFSFTFLLIKK